jgi:hypothetical protein
VGGEGLLPPEHAPEAMTRAMIHERLMPVVLPAPRRIARRQMPPPTWLSRVDVR